MYIDCAHKTEELGSGWQRIIGERELDKVIFADHVDIGEATLSLIKFKDGTFEVGQGMCLRPYLKFYSGEDEEEATRVFVKELVKQMNLERNDG